VPISPETRVIRLLVATLVGCMALASPAGASYLQMSEARPAAQKYASLYGVDGAPDGAKVDTCWRAGPRVVQCGYTIINPSQQTSPGPTVVIALRGDWLYGHSIGQIWQCVPSCNEGHPGPLTRLSKPLRLSRIGQ
jgi:hypothetical protein